MTQLILWYCLITMITLAICLHVWRQIKCLEVENRGLRAQNEIMAKLLYSIGGHWVAVLESQEQFGTHGRTTVPGKEERC